MAGKIKEIAKAAPGAVVNFVNPWKQSTGQEIARKVPMFALIGAIIGVAIVLLVLGQSGATYIVFGIFGGAAIGAALGLIAAYLPKGTFGVIFLLLILILAIYLGLAFRNYNQTGVAPAILGNLFSKLELPLAAMGEQLSCLFAPVSGNAKKMAECGYLGGGWETESEPEIIAMNVAYKTAELYDNAKEQEVRAEIQVTNTKDKGIKFFLEPKCFIDNKEVSSESYGTKESGKLVFLTRDTQQKASVVCKVPPEMLAGKNSIKARIDLERPVVQSVRWPVYTIKKEYYETRENLPSQISEGEGMSSTYFGVPYEFGIGVDESVPLTEGKHILYIKLKKDITTSQITGLKQINYIKVGGGGETAAIDSCNEFTKEGEVFALNNINQERITADGFDRGAVFDCEINVEPITASSSEVAQQQVTFEGEINYVVGFKNEYNIVVLQSTAAAV